MSYKRKNTPSHRIEGDIAYIPLSRGLEAIIDLADLHLVKDRIWHAETAAHGLTYYAVSNRKEGEGPGKVRMHRLLMDAPDELEVDHRDRNGIHNRRHNLRLATPAQNKANVGVRSHNGTGFKGVARDKRTCRFYARINIGNGKVKYLGVFASAEMAYEAYQKAAREYHGDFHSLT